MSNRAPPVAPRATVLLEEFFRNVAQGLYPKMALFEALAGFKEEPKRRKKSEDDIYEARRAFLDNFAYLCDIKKGGPTVTAAALQKLPFSNILWLAANEGIRPHVLTYAQAIWLELKRVDIATEKDIQDKIFQLAMANCAERIESYTAEVRRYSTKCRMRLRHETLSDIVRGLRSRLKKLSEPPATMTRGDLVDLCYDMRGQEVEAIRQRSTEAGDDFSRLAHNIGRLGATRSAVITVVRSTIQVPSLQQITGIRTVEAPEEIVVHLDPAQLNPYEIVRTICQKSASQNPVDTHTVLHAVVDLDLPSNGDIRASLEPRRTIVTRVHAELQMADRFSRHRFMEFVDSDKYIGCSKPACYFCFNWLSNHKHDYVLPATHLKIIPGCRGPDIRMNESGAAVLNDMYTKVRGVLDQDIIDFLLREKDNGPLRIHAYMSTEGSSRAPSRISTNPLQGML